MISEDQSYCSAMSAAAAVNCRPNFQSNLFFKTEKTIPYIYGGSKSCFRHRQQTVSCKQANKPYYTCKLTVPVVYLCVFVFFLSILKEGCVSSFKAHTFDIAMSVFQLNDWWSRQISSGDEEFDFGCMAVGNLDNASPATGNCNHPHFCFCVG